VFWYRASGQYDRTVNRRLAEIRKEKSVNPYTCVACGGAIDNKGFCLNCGAQAGTVCPVVVQFEFFRAVERT
jgi:hypothetical protein